MNLLQRHARQTAMVLFCYERLIIHGTLQHVGYADGMRRHLFRRHVRIFDFPLYAKPFTALQCTHMQRLAARRRLTIQFVAKASTRKENLIADIVARRGNHPGIVAILSAMESCTWFRPWHDKKTHRTFLRHSGGKCLHYYVYFIDPDYGLCHLRIPTWLPAALQFYCNGHSYVARQLTKKGVSYRMADNLFLAIADPIVAQTIADAFSPHALHGLLERCVRAFCPIATAIGDSYHLALLTTIARGEACISGLRNKHIRAHLTSRSPNAISRALKRLPVHGLIRRVAHTYKYYLTALGTRVITLALPIRQLIIFPSLAPPATFVP